VREVAHVARHDGHSVNQGGCGDEGVAHGPRPVYVQVGAPPGDGCLDRQDAVREGAQHMNVQPLAEQPPLTPVPSLRQQHAHLDLLNGNDRHEESATVTLDPDVAADLKRRARRTGRPFKLDLNDAVIGGTLAECDPFGIPSTSHWTGAAIIVPFPRTKSCIVTR
jgi:hypothetical protein